MYVIIAGGGKIGSNLARALVAAEHEILIIDRDKSRCETLEEELGSVTQVGDACDSHVLSEAGVSRADFFVATFGRDEDNLAACQLAKHRFSVTKTLSLVNNPGNEPLLELLQIDIAVNTTDLIVSRIEEEMTDPLLVHLKAIPGTTKAVVEIRIPPEAIVVGKALKDIPLPEMTIVTLVISRDGQSVRPDDETVLRANDEVLALTTDEEETALWEVLTEEV